VLAGIHSSRYDRWKACAPEGHPRLPLGVGSVAAALCRQICVIAFRQILRHISGGFCR